MTDRPEFNEHDYFKIDPNGYISRQVLIEHVNNSYDRMREIEEYVKRYDLTFDEYMNQWNGRLEELDDDIKGLLHDWIDDGTFTEIINEELFQTKADKEDLDKVTAQLAQTAINVLYPIDGLTPPTGDGIDDDTKALQDIIDYAIENQYNVFIPKPEKNYLISDNIMIENVDGFTLEIDKKALFKTTGDYQGINIYPSFHPAPHYRTFFTVRNTQNVTITGGEYDCSGFEHPGDGRAASVVLAIESSHTVVEETNFYDLAPEGVWGSIIDYVDGIPRELQYIGILGVKVNSMTIQNNQAENIAYSAYETKIASSDSKIIGNHAKKCGAHLTQTTPSYVSVDIKPEDYFSHGSLIAHNTGVGETTDITTHGSGTTVVGNTLIDVTKERSISVRINTQGSTITGNVLICTGEKGKAGIQFSGGRNHVVSGNTFINYEKAYDYESISTNAIIGENSYHDVDDRNPNDVTIGKSAGADNTSDRLTAIGAESGQNASGNGSSVFVGYRTGKGSHGRNITGVGDESAVDNNSDNLTAVGSEAGKNNSGNKPTVVGARAGLNNTGDGLIALGFEAGMNNTGDNAILLGNSIVAKDNTFSNVVGLGASPNADNQVRFGSKHLELNPLLEEPPVPAGYSVRLYVENNQIFALFGNGNKILVADGRN